MSMLYPSTLVGTLLQKVTDWRDASRADWQGQCRIIWPAEKSPKADATITDHLPAEAARETIVTVRRASLDFADAEQLSRTAARGRQTQRIVIDLQNVDDISTAAFARLVELRRSMLKRGRDLRLRGLHDRPAHRHAINRLQSILPNE